MRLIASLLGLSMMTACAFAQAETKAEGSVTVGKPAGVKVAKAECQALWTKANPAKKPKISAGQALPFIADVKGANSNGDAAIDQNEFMAACDKGLMKDQANSGGSASTGSSPGTEGAGPAQPAGQPAAAQ